MIVIDYDPNFTVINPDGTMFIPSSAEVIGLTTPSVTLNEPFDSQVDFYSDGYRNGYMLKEWNTESDGSGTAYQPGDSVTESLELYAIWERYNLEGTVWTFKDNPSSFPEAGELVIAENQNGSYALIGDSKRRRGLYFANTGSVSSIDVDAETIYANGIWKKPDAKTITFIKEPKDYTPNFYAFVKMLEADADIQTDSSYVTSGKDLSRIATLICEKAGTDDVIEYPNGFVSALESIEEAMSATVVNVMVDIDNPASTLAGGYADVDVKVMGSDLPSDASDGQNCYFTIIGVNKVYDGDTPIIVPAFVNSQYIRVKNYYDGAKSTVRIMNDSQVAHTFTKVQLRVAVVNSKSGT